MSKGPTKKTGKTAAKAKAKPKVSNKAASRAKAKVKPQAKPQAKAKPRTKPKPPPSSQDASKASADTVQAATETSRPGGSLSGVTVALFLIVIGAGSYTAWKYWPVTAKPGSAKVASSPAVTAKPAPAPVPTAKPKVEEKGANKSPGDETAMEKMAAESRKLRQSLDRLMTRMESIEQSVEKVKKLAQATVPPSEKIRNDPVLESLTGRLNALEESGDAVKVLIERMDRMEKDSAAQLKAETQAAAETNTSAKALVLAVAELREAVASGKPFGQELDALKALAGDNPDFKAPIVVLVKNADKGIPTLDGLRIQFEELAGKIVQASRTVKETGWLDRAANRLSSLVTWRRVDGQGEETSIDAMVAAAENHLKTGDLKSAIIALEGLAGNAKASAVAEPWLSSAKAHLAAERAVGSLRLQAVSILTPVKPGEG